MTKLEANSEVENAGCCLGLAALSAGVLAVLATGLAFLGIALVGWAWRLF